MAEPERCPDCGEHHKPGGRFCRPTYHDTDAGLLQRYPDAARVLAERDEPLPRH